MDRDSLLNEVQHEFDNVHDMDTPWSVYASAALRATGWRSVETKPDPGCRFVATDGNGVWIDMWNEGEAWPPTFGYQNIVAKQWHPIQPIPSNS